VACDVEACEAATCEVDSAEKEDPNEMFIFEEEEEEF